MLFVVLVHFLLKCIYVGEGRGYFIDSRIQNILPRPRPNYKLLLTFRVIVLFSRINAKFNNVSYSPQLLLLVFIYMTREYNKNLMPFLFAGGYLNIYKDIISRSVSNQDPRHEIITLRPVADALRAGQHTTHNQSHKNTGLCRSRAG